MSDYSKITIDLKLFLESEDKDISKICNALSYLYFNIKDINWIGIYFLEGSNLYLGPFMGKPACSSIMKGKGVCSKALVDKKEVVVEDVHKFSEHIACDKETNSEL